MMTKIYRSKLEGRSKKYIQKLQQQWDDMTINSKRKGSAYEKELVKSLQES